MLDFAVRLTGLFFEPIEPDIEPDLRLVGAGLVLLSAGVTIGAILMLIF